ncbi:MAG: hypothetical protein ACTSP0_05990 [Alphaproteobacteria bacterium]
MRVLRAVRRWAVLSGVIIGLGVIPAAGQTRGFETPPNLSSKQALPPALRQGPYHTILDPVQNDGFLNSYRMKTRSGEFEIVGTGLLKIRVREAEAAAKLAEISGGDQMLKSAGRTVTKPFKTGKDLITEPGATVKRTFRGVGRFFGRVGASMNATDPSRESMIGSITGAGEAKRRLAYKMGVDPYTQFAPLSEQLSRLAGASALGGTATGVGLAFVSGGAGLAISVGGTSESLRALLRDKSAAELEKIGRNMLSEMGVSPGTINAFYLNQLLTPTDKAIIIQALKGLGGVNNRAIFVASAARVPSLSAAFALRWRIEMTRAYHAKIAPITAFVNLGGVPMVRTANGVVGLFSIDFLPWTNKFASMVKSANRDKQAIAGSAPIEFWITGRASRKTASNLKKNGWRLIENAGSRLGG